MKFCLALLFFSSIVMASPLAQWSSKTEIRERHEFYKNNEVLTRPAGTWQTLFAVVYADRSLALHKDCVFYRVPGLEDGIFKVKKVPLETDCEKFLLASGDFELPALKALQFSLTDKEISIHFTDANFRSQKWEIKFANVKKKKAPGLFVSSADFQSPKLIFLADTKEGGEAIKPKKAGELCHAVDDDCNELSASTCGQCEQGWYEVPNGCPIGPKYCGVVECGEKNAPACRRGMTWQRVRKKFDCRQDTSFAYCRAGLRIECEGALAFCR